MIDSFRLAGHLATALPICLLFASCASGSSALRHRQLGYLRLEVEPPTAEVEIDDEYHGVVEGWVQKVVPVAPGVKRLTLRADGYMTQRFDIEVSAGEEVTLELRLEPQLELSPDSSDARSSNVGVRR